MVSDSELKLSRYEVKYTLHQSNYFFIRNWIVLNDADFISPYGARTVNNIYFDNLECDSYVENLTGCTSRTKIRLRWYGNTHSPKEATLEIKAKRNKLGFKSSRKIMLGGRSLIDMTYRELCRTILEQIDGDFKVRFCVSSTPIIINRYRREYFVTRNMAVRATLDKHLEFFDQRSKVSPNMSLSALAPEMGILEFKVNSLDIDKLPEVLVNIPLPASKSSKYVIGVQSILGYQ